MSPIETSERSVEEYANRFLERKIMQFERFKAIAEGKVKELPKDDTTPASARDHWVLSFFLFGILIEIYEILAVIQKDMFSYDREYLQIEKNLRALGRTVGKPEYKHIQNLLAKLADMERQTRNRPIDDMMYRG